MPSIRRKVLKKQKYKCLVCGIAFKLGFSLSGHRWKNGATLHHIVPACCGGPRRHWNLVALHRNCHDVVERNLAPWTIVFVRHLVQRARHEVKMKQIYMQPIGDEYGPLDSSI